jgi:hypothetical protein
LVRYDNLRRSVGLPAPNTSWHSKLTGLERPNTQLAGRPDIDIDELRRPPPETSEKPWEILRMAIIWSLWCQKCEHDLREGQFHIGIALFQSWQLTVQSGMGAWRELIRYAKEPKSKKQQQREADFKTIWAARGIFCTLQGSQIKWKMAPGPVFLSRDLANLYRSLRGIQPGEEQSPRATAESSDRYSQSCSSFRELPEILKKLLQDIASYNSEAEELANEILDIMIGDIEREIDLEENDEEDEAQQDQNGEMSTSLSHFAGNNDQAESKHEEQDDEDTLGLPDDLQDATDLAAQVRFWINDL